MKNRAIAGLFGLLLIAFSAGSALGQGSGMMFRAGGIVPEKDDEWDLGAAFDIGFVFWGSPNVGLWVGAGAQGWNMARETVALDDGGWATIDGRVSVVPIGASVLLWGDLGNHFALQAEGGMRYAVVDSDASVESWRPYSRDYMAVYKDPIEIDDTVLAVASLQLEYAVDMWSFGLGGGFQWDLSNPDQKVLGQSIAKTSFAAAFFFASLSIAF